MLDGVEHGAFGDLVERHALDIDALDRLALDQRLQDVPRDGLALAVGVGGQIQVLGPVERLGDRIQVLGRAGVGNVGHREVLVGANRAVLRRQIAHVAIARQHPVVVAEISIDGLGLGGRFDDDDVHVDYAYPLHGAGSEPSDPRF